MAVTTAEVGGLPTLVLTLSCPDAPGIVYAVAKFLLEHDCNIVQSQQYEDRQSDRFFMRVEFQPVTASDADATLLVRLTAGFEAVAGPRSMTWRLVDSGVRQRVLILVSQVGHCLNDLVFRQQSGGLDIDIVAVVSNHTDLRRLAESYAVPFVHIPVTATTKPAAEARLLEVIEDRRADLVVLARYMQVLSDDLCARLEGRAINIHHSMLPSFKGARPYHQAHQRGVKLVGATAHYVTADLDEGPIIEQEVARVDHAMTAEQVAAQGRDVECQALARAVRWHTESRVMIAGRRTVVFH